MGLICFRKDSGQEEYFYFIEEKKLMFRSGGITTYSMCRSMSHVIETFHNIHDIYWEPDA